MNSAALDLGEQVIDSEDDTPSVAEVVEAPGTLASEHTIPAMGKTVAQANPEYPADDRVDGIRFVRDGEPPGPTYHYPASRLEQVGADWEPSDAARKSDGRREREDLPIIGDGRADPGDGDRTISEYGTVADPSAAGGERQ